MTDATYAWLSWLNLLVADMQTGFGPFISVRLTVAGWHPGEIGAALSLASIASILAQVPAGMVVDAFPSKRGVAAAAILAAMTALLLIAIFPGPIPIFVAAVLQGVSGAVLTLAIASITLAVTEADQLGERFGRNVRFGGLGAAMGAVLLGLVGGVFSSSAVFVVAASFGAAALFALGRIKDPVLVPPPSVVRRARPLPEAKRRVLCDLRLVAFIGCCFAFHLSNAAQLPLAVTEAAHRADGLANFVTGAALTVPQLLVAGLSPWVGRMAGRHGRRPLLLIGYVALPARALLFAISPSPEMVVLAQALDGIGGAVFGVLLPLVVADIAHKGGRYTFALGLVSVAVGLGGAASNTIAGWVANVAGLHAAFLLLALFGAGATVLVWWIMPETAPPALAPHVPELPTKAPLTPDPV